MKKPPDISLPVLRKTDITRLRIASHGPGKFSELTIEVAALRCSGSPDEYQLRCRHHSSRSNEKHWIRVVDQNDFQQALESLSHSRVPVIPVETVVGDGPETELTLWWGANRVAYTWWCLPPSGYECLANFVDRLVVWAGAAEYLGWDKGLEDRLNEPALVDLAGRKIYARGLQYSEAGHVTELCKTESELSLRLPDGRHGFVLQACGGSGVGVVGVDWYRGIRIARLYGGAPAQASRRAQGKASRSA